MSLKSADFYKLADEIAELLESYNLQVDDLELISNLIEATIKHTNEKKLTKKS